jgi:hypothetical protein
VASLACRETEYFWLIGDAPAQKIEITRYHPNIVEILSDAPAS